MHQWEDQSLRETNRLRKLIGQKRDEIGTVRVQMCLQVTVCFFYSSPAFLTHVVVMLPSFLIDFLHFGAK